MLHMGEYVCVWCIWLCKCAYGLMRELDSVVHMGVYGCIWVYMGVYGCIWVCKLSCGILTVGVIGAGVFGHVYPRVHQPLRVLLFFIVGVCGAGVPGHVYPRSYQPLRVRWSAGVDPSGGW